jgi:hypothetical protein
VFECLIIEIFIFKGTPVSDEQSVGVVLCPRDILYLTSGLDTAFQVTATALNELRSIVGKLPRALVEVDAVTDDSADGRGRDDITE